MGNGKWLATSKQCNFLDTLLKERQHEYKISGQKITDYASFIENVSGRAITTKEASDTISHLLKYPKEVEFQKVEAENKEQNNAIGDVQKGRYALYDNYGELHFFMVDVPEKGRWEGYRFLKYRYGDGWRNYRNREERNAIMQRISRSPLDAMQLYARKEVRCARCGKHLTDNESMDRGFGPDCWKEVR